MSDGVELKKHPREDQRPLNLWDGEQRRYCGTIIKDLKKHRDSAPFLVPVDPVLLNIPDYPSIIKKPMDLGTVEQKLNNLEYETVDDFANDMNLIFSNCYLYNGTEAPVSQCASNLEKAFNKLLHRMPGEQAGETADEKRPKRDVQAPSKDIQTGIASKRRGTEMWKNDPQLRHCQSILREFSKKSNADFMFPFMQPVDWVALQIPDYPKIIKEPMDIGTIRQKLENDEYSKAAQFEKDVRKVVNNCLVFNPKGTPVYDYGLKLEKLFNSKWAQLPPAPVEEVEVDSEDDESDEMDSSDDKIAEMERHLKSLSEKLETMKATKKKEKSDRKSVPKPPPEKPKPKVVPSVPRESSKTTEKKKPTKRSEPRYTSSDDDDEDDVPRITFEQKRELSERINEFEGHQLANVVQIIHDSMPHLRDSGGQEEIELDMDSLDPRTLYRLYRYVRNSAKQKQPPQKKVKAQYSQEDASKKITELEQTLQKLPRAPQGKEILREVSSSSSGSSSDSDSVDSGSDSD
ncbi:MAG: Bromodomain-containing protein [Benniella sp.]|nr:MAG: Bromodomain-containing protein [Benniella sp.]